MRAGDYWTAQGNVLWRIADILPISNQALYGGVGVEGGYVADRIDPVPDGGLYGISGYIGGRTPVGTLTIGVGKATGTWADGSRSERPLAQGRFSISDFPLSAMMVTEASSNRPASTMLRRAAQRPACFSLAC